MYFLFCPVHFLSLYCVINKLILLFIISLTLKICISVHSHSLFQFVKDQQFCMICVLSFIHSFIHHHHHSALAFTLISINKSLFINSISFLLLVIVLLLFSQQISDVQLNLGIQQINYLTKCIQFQCSHLIYCKCATRQNENSQ